MATRGNANKWAESSRDKSLDAACLIFLSPVPVIGRDGCDFAFGIEFRETDSLFNYHQIIYDTSLLW